MKFQNCDLIFVTDAQTDGRTDGRTDGQAQRNMLLQLFQSWGHKKEVAQMDYNHLPEFKVTLYLRFQITLVIIWHHVGD